MSANLGLIARFEQVAKVPPRPGINVLGKRTIETYTFWLRLFYGFVRRPASTWAGSDIEAFCQWLERERYAPKSRHQALCAIIYVFKHVLNIEPGTLTLPAMPREKRLVRIIPSRSELASIFALLRGQVRLMAGLIFGSGVRVSECCEIRMKDVDLEKRTLRVHGGKGDKDRITVIPHLLVPALQRQMQWRAALHERDLRAGAGLVELPGRLAIKYKAAPRELAWQFFFPSFVVRNGYRWYFTPQGVQKAMKQAVHGAGILKKVTPHTLRHAFCTYAQEDGAPMKVVADLMGHEDLNTTAIYTHADRALGRSPLDGPAPRPENAFAKIGF